MEADRLDALTFDSKTRTVTGMLPDGTVKVHVQYLSNCMECGGTGKTGNGDNRRVCPLCKGSAEGGWMGTTQPRRMDEAVISFQRCVDSGGPYTFRKYRLVPAVMTENSNLKTTGDKNMADKKVSKAAGKTVTKATKTAAPKAPKAPAEKTERVAGIFVPGSHKAIIYTMLADGKFHGKDELFEALKENGCKGAAGRIRIVSDNLTKKKGLKIEQKDDQYRIVKLGGKTDTPAATTAPAKKTAAKKSAKPASTATPAPAPDSVSVE